MSTWFTLKLKKRSNKKNYSWLFAWLSLCIIGAEIVGGAVRVLESGAPNDVWRRNNDPKTRLFFDSSDVLDANEPVL